MDPEERAGKETQIWCNRDNLNPELHSMAILRFCLALPNPDVISAIRLVCGLPRDHALGPHHIGIDNLGSDFDCVKQVVSLGSLRKCDAAHKITPDRINLSLFDQS